MADEVIQLGDDFFKDLNPTDLDDGIGLDLLSNTKPSGGGSGDGAGKTDSKNEVVRETTGVKITGLDEFDAPPPKNDPPVVNLNTNDTEPKPSVFD